eukprot:m.13115 g.13115  ORF g.13115 m.13115 type:complete len:421 (+) comp5901_c0_seq1:167-1429(+)
MASAARPTLSGQRTKGRKRDEKLKHEPQVFRTDLLTQLNSFDTLEDGAKWLEGAGNSLDYRRYNEVLFDVLIAGGTLAPGGALEEMKEDVCKFCVFEAEDSLEGVKQSAELVQRVVARYKYLEAHLEEELKKVLIFINSFPVANRSKLAKFTAFVMSCGISSAKPIESLFQETLTKEGTAADFLAAVFLAWLQYSNISTLAAAFKKAGLDSRLEDVMPSTRNTTEQFDEQFQSYEGMGPVMEWRSALKLADAKKKLQRKLARDMAAGKKNAVQLAVDLHKEAQATKLKHADLVPMIWAEVLNAVEWNKKADLVAEQAFRQIHTYSTLLAFFAQTMATQVLLLNNIQGSMYEKQTLLNSFGKIVYLLYHDKVLSEQAIVDWFKYSHSSKAKSVVLTQVTPMIEWFGTAEIAQDDAAAAAAE